MLHATKYSSILRVFWQPCLVVFRSCHFERGGQFLHYLRSVLRNYPVIGDLMVLKYKTLSYLLVDVHQNIPLSIWGALVCRMG